MRKVSLLIFFTALCSACLFGPSHTSGVKNFNREQVELKDGTRYRTGALSPTWQRSSSRAKVASFYHSQLHSTIYSDAFCGAQFEDVKPTELMSQLESGLESKTQLKHSTVQVSGREALQSTFLGKLDGAQVSTQAVVLKRDRCMFDFVLISQPSFFVAAQADFQKFISGFEMLAPRNSKCRGHWCGAQP